MASSEGARGASRSPRHRETNATELAAAGSFLPSPSRAGGTPAPPQPPSAGARPVQPPCHGQGHLALHQVAHPTSVLPPSPGLRRGNVFGLRGFGIVLHKFLLLQKRGVKK